MIFLCLASSARFLDAGYIFLKLSAIISGTRPFDDIRYFAAHDACNIF